MTEEIIAGRNYFRQQVVAEYKPARNVPIVEFAESSDFCDKPLYPKQQVLAKLWFLEEMDGWEEDVLSGWIRGDGGTMISPMVRERRDYLRERGYKHFGEIILDGGRRSSKGYMTGLAVAKKIHDVQQLPDPGRHYGIDPDKQILFSVVANKLEQARDLQWADIASWSGRCVPLQQHIPQFLTESFSISTAADREYQKELEERGTKVNADWSKLICRPLPARQSTLRGSASMVIVFDEFAHMLGTEGAASGSACFEAALPSLRQFGRDGLIFCNSSPYTEIGQFFEEYEKAMQLDGAHPAFPEYLFINFPSWELYTDWRKHPHRLSVDQQRLGSLMVAPECPDEVPDRTGKMVPLTDEELAKREKARLDERANPETYAVEARAQWAKVVDSYLSAPVVDLAFAPNVIIGDFEKSISMNMKSNYNYHFVAHCDPSSTTAGFGFAVGHVEMMPDPFQPERECQHVVFDLVKRWNPADFPGHTIDYLQVQQELAAYCQRYFLKRLTFDQFQSQAPIQWLNQELRQRRLSTQVFEVTATQKVNWNRYETFKTAMNMQRVHIPFDCPDSLYAMDELKFLQVKNGKVEKQDTGPVRTKDIADCIAEVTAHLLGDSLAAMQGGLEQRIQAGAEGGYQIGGRNQGGPMGGAGGSASFDEFYQAQARKRGENTMGTRGIQRRKRY